MSSDQQVVGRVGLVSSFLRRGISPSYAESGIVVVNQKCIRPHGILDLSHSRNHDLSEREIPEELLIRAGDILVNSTGTGTLGRSCVVKEAPAKMTWDSHITLVRPRHGEVHPSYLGWVIQSEEQRFVELSVGSTNQVELSRSTVSNLSISLPPLETQQRIAGYLDRETAEIDAAVTDLDRYVKLLSLRVKTAIHHAVLGGVDSESRKLLHPVIGTIPSSWAVSKFSVEFLESNNLNGPEPVGDLLSISEFHGVIVNNRGQEGQQSSEDVSHYRVVKPNQLAANMMWLDHGGLGVSSLRGYISPDYRAFDISNKLLPEYVHYLLRSKSYVDYFSTISVGVRPNAKRTTKVTLGMTPIPVPPLEVQASIVSRIEAETLEIESLIAESTKLRELLLKRRSVLITDVVTGRKQV